MKCILTGIVLFICTSVSFARDYYIDPQKGSINNSGTFSNPWNTLADVLSSGKTFQPGDQIFLLRGYHGAPYITGRHSRDVYIKAYPGHSPAVFSVRFMNATHWHLSNLTVSKETAPTGHPDLNLEIPGGITIDDQKNEDSHYITIENCSLYTQQNNTNFTATMWANLKAAILVHGTHHTIKGNHLYNGGGIQIMFHANNTYVGHNVIENIGTDASGIRSHNNIIEHNLFMNSHKVNGNHNDLMQAWGSSNNIVRHNELRAYTNPNQPFISDDPDRKGISSCQGLGMFDGVFENWVIEHNLIRVDHRIGIYAHNLQKSIIRNNKIVRRGPKVWKRTRPPAIFVGESKTGSPSRGNKVYNNEAEDFEIGRKTNNGYPIGRTADIYNNVETREYNPPVDNEAPSQPKNLFSYVIPGYGVDLRWDPATDNTNVKGYHIYRDGVRIGKKRTGTHFLDPHYRHQSIYQVSAFDYNGNESVKSKRNQNGYQESPEPVPEPQPEPSPEPNPSPNPEPTPTPFPEPQFYEGANSLTGWRIANTEILLTWKSPTNNPPLKEYGIVLGDNSRVWKRVKTVSGSTFSTVLTYSNGIRAGENAKLQVRAVLSDGTKLPMSEQIVVTTTVVSAPEPTPTPLPEPNPTPVPEPSPVPPPPPPPEPDPSPVPLVYEGAHSLIGLRVAKSTIELSWQAPTGNPDLREYGIVLGPDNRSWKRVKTVSGTTLNTTLTYYEGIRSTENAKLQVRAVLKDGTKLPMSEQIVVTTAIVELPEPEPSPTPLPEPTPSPVPDPAPEPSPSPAPEPTPDLNDKYPVIYPAIEAHLSGPTINGDMADFINPENDFIEWTVSNHKDNVFDLIFHYSLSSGDRPLELRLDGNVVLPKMSFPKTGGWKIIKSVKHTIFLPPGVHKVRLTAIGYSGGNFKSLTLALNNTLSLDKAIDQQPTPINSNGGCFIRL